MRVRLYLGGLLLAVSLGIGWKHESQQAKATHSTCPVITYDVQAKLHYWNLGAELEGQGRYKEAAVAYQRALCIDPTDAYVKDDLQRVSQK